MEHDCLLLLQSPHQLLYQCGVKFLVSFVSCARSSWDYSAVVPVVESSCYVTRSLFCKVIQDLGLVPGKKRRLPLVLDSGGDIR